MKVFVTGSEGQLGRTLAATMPHGIELTRGNLPALDTSDLPALQSRLADDAPSPLGVYGRAKLDGEVAVLDATDGDASWFEFAEAIYRKARDSGLLDRDVEVLPIPTAGYPTPARRPVYSVLDCSVSVAALGLEQRPRRERLQQMLMQMRD